MPAFAKLDSNSARRRLAFAGKPLPSRSSAGVSQAAYGKSIDALGGAPVAVGVTPSAAARVRPIGQNRAHGVGRLCHGAMPSTSPGRSRNPIGQND
jgi:hypothetical protein